MPDQVFVTQRVNVYLRGTPDNPDGSVVVFQPGLNDVPESAAADPFVAHLVKATAPAVAQAQADAETQAATEKATQDKLDALATSQKASLDEMAAASEEWATNRQAAIDAGKVFTDPHPDPVTEQSMVLTASPHNYAVSSIISSSMASGSPPPSATRVLPDTGP
jgi:hypothetical protein